MVWFAYCVYAGYGLVSSISSLMLRLVISLFMLVVSLFKLGI